MNNEFTSEASFRELYLASAGRVFGYLRRHVDAADVEDILAEVFLVAWSKRTQLPPDPVPYLIGVARNLALSYWRKRSAEEKRQEQLAAVAEIAATPADADANERLALIEALQQLSENDREALLLVGWDGLSHREAAEVVGCTSNTFAARLMRARNRLDELVDSSTTDNREVSA